MQRAKLWVMCMLLAAATATPDPASAAEANRVAVARAYINRLEAFGFSGQVLIADSGHTVVDESFGLADGAGGAAITAGTRFPIGSLTKPFTALAIVVLEGDGRLSLADTLGRFLQGVPPDKAAITLEQLLTHTAGLKRDLLRASDSIGRDEAVRRILAEPLRQPPGQGFAYSNAGYELLAAIVEQAAGEPYEAFVARRVFDPAGMTESGFVNEPLRSGTPIARGHRDGAPNGKRFDAQPGWKSTGSGSAYSTSRALARWHRALLEGRIVPPSERERMMAPRVETGDGTHYGYGWFVNWPGTDSTLIFHGGDTDGFHSELRWYTREDQLIVVLTNQDVFDIDGGAVAKRLIARDLRRIMLGREFTELPAAVPTDSTGWATIVGRYDLPTEDQFSLVRVGGGLRIEANGSSAAAALLPPAATLDSMQRAFDGRAAALLRAAADNDTSELGSSLDRADFEFGYPFLISELKDYSKRYGALKEIELFGSAPIPWDDNVWRTYAELRFERGAFDLFFGRASGKLNDVTSDAGFLHSVTLPVARVESGDFAALDILRMRSIPVTIERDTNGAATALRIGGPSGVRAVRVR